MFFPFAHQLTWVLNQSQSTLLINSQAVDQHFGQPKAFDEIMERGYQYALSHMETRKEQPDLP